MSNGIIKINEEAFVLPTDAATRHSVLNHLDMTIKGVKDFIKLRKLSDGTEVKFCTLELNHAIIDIR